MLNELVLAGRTSVLRAAALALVPPALTGCVSLPVLPAALTAPAPSFSPERFFQGKTEGAGTIVIMLKGRHAVHVHASVTYDPTARSSCRSGWTKMASGPGNACGACGRCRRDATPGR